MVTSKPLCRSRRGSLQQGTKTCLSSRRPKGCGARMIWGQGLGFRCMLQWKEERREAGLRVRRTTDEFTVVGVRGPLPCAAMPCHAFSWCPGAPTMCCHALPCLLMVFEGPYHVLPCLAMPSHGVRGAIYHVLPCQPSARPPLWVVIDLAAVKAPRRVLVCHMGSSSPHCTPNADVMSPIGRLLHSRVVVASPY